MYLGTSRAQEGLTPSEWRRTRRVLLSVPLAILLSPIVMIAAIVGYSLIVPPHAATMDIPAIAARLTLKFYYVWSDGDEGRRLTINAPNGSTTFAMTAFDWAHNARTSIYLSPDRRIAVLGPAGDDHIVSLDPPQASALAVLPSDDWTYLGAFDFAYESGARVLRFMTAAEQAECIPMVGAEKSAPREAARRRNCPAYERR